MIAVYVTRNFDLAHIGDKPYVCTGCDKDFIYELYTSETILGCWILKSNVMKFWIKLRSEYIKIIEKYEERNSMTIMFS